MKFFWKVFLSTLFTAVFAFSAGNFLLIDSQFRSSFSKEVEAAYTENSLLRRSLHRELETLQETYSYKGVPASQYEADGAPASALLRAAALSVSGSISGGTLPFRLCTAEGNPVFSQLPSPSSGLIAGLTPESQGYVLVSSGHSHTLHIAGPLILGEKTYYLENTREVSDLFQSRDSLYRTFLLLTLALAAICAVLSFFLSHRLTKPVEILSAATRKLAQGDLSRRAEVRSKDELGGLAEDFNAMASQLEQNVQELKEEARRREEFTASFAHELKTPLTSMIGYADLLRSRSLGEKDTVLCANYIFEEGRRLEALSMKLMELIVLQKQEFPLRRILASQLFSRVEAAVRPSMEIAGARFSVVCEEAELPLEPDLMQTVCINLLDNARKSLGQNGAVTLLGHWGPEDSYTIAVQDNGKGIPAEDLNKITEPFYMVDKSRARAQGGAGLGLSLCRSIVLLHGGELTFESTPGKGTLAAVHLKEVNRFES